MENNDKKDDAKNQIKNEPLIKKFSKIKTALQELERTYAKDEDIDVEIFDSKAYLYLGNFSRSIFINSTVEENYSIRDSHKTGLQSFITSEEVVGYIVEQVEKFLAEKESR